MRKIRKPNRFECLIDYWNLSSWSYIDKRNQKKSKSTMIIKTDSIYNRLSLSQQCIPLCFVWIDGQALNWPVCVLHLWLSYTITIISDFNNLAMYKKAKWSSGFPSNLLVHQEGMQEAMEGTRFLHSFLMSSSPERIELVWGSYLLYLADGLPAQANINYYYAAILWILKLKDQSRKRNEFSTCSIYYWPTHRAHSSLWQHTRSIPN